MHFCTICEIIVLLGGPGKSDVVLEKSLKNGCNFLYKPCNVLCPSALEEKRALRIRIHLVRSATDQVKAVRELT